MDVKVCKRDEIRNREGKCVNRRKYLKSIALEFESVVSKSPIVGSIVGIGSFHRGMKKVPKDVDYVVNLKVPFADKKVFGLSHKIEKLKEKYKDERGSTLFNAFIQDSEGDKLNSVDLWFIEYKGEKLSENIDNRRAELEPYSRQWKRGKIIYKA